MSTSQQVGADRNHQQIPFPILAIFEDTTDAAIQSMVDDPALDVTFRMYARYELAYRTAYGILVDFDPKTWNIRHRTFASDAALLAGIAEDEAVRKATKPVDRTRWLRGISPETLKAQYDAAPERTCDACGAVFKALRGPELCTPCWTAFRDNSARVQSWAL